MSFLPVFMQPAHVNSHMFWHLQDVVVAIIAVEVDTWDIPRATEIRYLPMEADATEIRYDF